MKVKFKHNWFGPTEEWDKDSRVVSGHMYRRGVHEDVPDHYRNRLPTSATILDDDWQPEEEEVYTGPDHVKLPESTAAVLNRKSVSPEDRVKRKRKNA